jgi:hypothetical protein
MSPDDPVTERDEIRELLADNIRALNDRVERTRTDDLDAETEQRQLQRLRTMAQLARQYRLLARDADVDEMEEDVELLADALSRE